MTAPESHGGALLHAGLAQRRIRAQGRHGLPLHVRAHQGAVGVVVLQERDHRRRDRDELQRRDVHVLDLGRLDDRVPVLVPHLHLRLDERVVVVQHDVGRRDLVAGARRRRAASRGRR